jgi:FkbM family methyltransferase
LADPEFAHSSQSPGWPPRACRAKALPDGLPSDFNRVKAGDRPRRREGPMAMRHVQRKLGFVLAASSHGPMIVDRFDFARDGDHLFGVGGEILEFSHFDPDEIELMLAALRLRRKHFGDGVAALDCGANIGVHTLEAAIEMTGWGSIFAIEAQERLFYALAGNIALNNCFNAGAVHAAVAGHDGSMRVPVPDYLRPGSFGSLEMRPRDDGQSIGQPIDYSPDTTKEIRTVKLDSLAAPRCDFIKMDIEGMEVEALGGGREMITRHTPIILVEWVKSPKDELRGLIEGLGYRVLERGRNFVCVHQGDPCLADIRVSGGAVT